MYKSLDLGAAGVNLIYLAVMSVALPAAAYLIDALTPWLRSKTSARTRSTSMSQAVKVRVCAAHAGTCASAYVRIVGCCSAPLQVGNTLEDEDVAAERARVASGAADGDVLVVRDLRKQYGDGKVAVESLAFGIPVGQCFGFLGINGAGKTTTLKMLSGDHVPTSGTAAVAGFDIVTEQLQLRRLLGCVLGRCAIGVSVWQLYRTGLCGLAGLCDDDRTGTAPSSTRCSRS